MAKKKIIAKLYHDFPYQIYEIEESAKMVEGRRLSSLNWGDYNEENLKEMQLHNAWINRMKEALDNIKFFKLSKK